MAKARNLKLKFIVGGIVMGKSGSHDVSRKDISIIAGWGTIDLEINPESEKRKDAEKKRPPGEMDSILEQLEEITI